MESGLIKIRCGFGLQDKSQFTDDVVKQKVTSILILKNTLFVF